MFHSNAAHLYFRFRDTMVNTIGAGHTERSLQLGTMYNADQALKLDLVNEVVAPDQVISTANEQIKEWIAIPCMYC